VKKKIKILEFRVDAKSAMPIYEQIKEVIKYNIISGTLVSGDRLMSLRDLAMRIKIHPNTIVKAYYQLEVEGFIESKPGKGYFVKQNRKIFSKAKKDVFEKSVREFISKSTKLGFGMDDIFKELKKIDKERTMRKSEEKDDRN